MNDHPAIVLFRELLDVPAPSGREERLAEIVCAKLETLDLAHHIDPAGNVLVRLEGRRADLGTLALASHMDEIGMVVTAVRPDGVLGVGPSGGLFPWKLGEGPVDVVGDEAVVPGILSMGSTHRLDAAGSTVTWKDVHIITDLSPERLASAGVRPGSTAVPARAHRGPVFLGESDDPLVAAWTFDDRMGVVTLLRLLESLGRGNVRPARPTLICFTVHEEGGGHGAKALAARERPEAFIAVDGCPMPPGVPLVLDGRPGVWSKDQLTHFDQRIVRALCRAAREAGTELQPVVYERAFSDASAVYASGNAPRAATVGHVRENSHGYEVARLSCFDNLLKTLLRFVETWE